MQSHSYQKTVWPYTRLMFTCSFAANNCIDLQLNCYYTSTGMPRQRFGCIVVIRQWSDHTRLGKCHSLVSEDVTQDWIDDKTIQRSG